MATFGLLIARGGGSEVVNQTSITTMSQELQDMEASFKKGIITEKKYNNAKESILKKYEK